MAYFEIYKSDLPADKEKYAEWVIDLAYWMINEHRTLKRRRNTAYAYEGMICAWELARLTGNAEALRMIGDVINDGLYKLTSWQVGSPIQNAFLLRNRTNDPRAIGGVMNHRREAPLRIDVCQHQMHAVILAARYVYQEKENQKTAGVRIGVLKKSQNKKQVDHAQVQPLTGSHSELPRLAAISCNRVSNRVAPR